MIPDELIEQVRDAADAVALIGETVELKRTGSDYRGPCPFHGGTHRNFAVIPRKGLFYCYVCHEKGDVFSYFMKRFGMDYPAAVREVARRTGIDIPDRPTRSGPDPHEALYGAVGAAQDWFARQLVESKEAEPARAYLASRDIALEQVAPLGLGFAPTGKAFLSAMEALGVGEPVLLEAGLAARRDDGTVVPRFRARLLFPIHDLRGRVVGFGGRLLGPGEPKYLNSPETPIFSKGRMLYNLHSAKQAIRREESALLVEGYFDVLRLSLAGVDNVVAPLGTALTGEQAALLRRYTTSVTLLYDSDLAGLRATFRAGDELLRHGVRVRVATMAAGEDPDTLVRSGGPDALATVVGEAIDVMERKIQLLERRGWFEGVEHRRDALDRLLPTIRAAADAITRELYLSLVAERTGVSREVLEREAAERPRGAPAATASAEQPPGRRPEIDRLPEPTGKRATAAPVEFSLVRLLFAAPEWLQRVRQEIGLNVIRDNELRALLEKMLEIGEVAAEQLPTGLSPAAERVWARVKEASLTVDRANSDKMVEDIVQQLRDRPLREELDDLNRRIEGLASNDEKTDVLNRIREIEAKLRPKARQFAVPRIQIHRKPR
jgi:DNA primase